MLKNGPPYSPASDPYSFEELLTSASDHTVHFADLDHFDKGFEDFEKVRARGGVSFGGTN